MTRVLLPLALLAAGCVPVTEPVGDIDKSAPDKGLVGKWTVTKTRGEIPPLLAVKTVTIDVPAVKDNPKGLMRVTHDGEKLKVLWFYPATVGKHTYATCLLTTQEVPALEDEGQFAKWKKVDDKRYFIFEYVLNGDELVIDCGSPKAVKAVMEAAEFKEADGTAITFYKTPAGWLDKFLDKPGPDGLFDRTSSLTLKRQK